LFLFTPSHNIGSKYSISVIEHCSHIRRNISIGFDDECISDIDSIDVRNRVLCINKRRKVICHTKARSVNKYLTIDIMDFCLF